MAPTPSILQAPAEESKPLFLQFAQYEEQHGLARNAMQVRPHTLLPLRLRLLRLLLHCGLLWPSCHATRADNAGGYGCPYAQGPCRTASIPSSPRPLMWGHVCVVWLQVYDQAVKKVPEKERLSVYDIYVSRASEFFGIGKVRHRAGRGKGHYCARGGAGFLCACAGRGGGVPGGSQVGPCSPGWPAHPAVLGCLPCPTLVLLCV